MDVTLFLLGPLILLLLLGQHIAFALLLSAFLGYYFLLGGPLPTKVKRPKYQSWRGYEEHLPKHVWRMGMSIMHGG